MEFGELKQYIIPGLIVVVALFTVGNFAFSVTSGVDQVKSAWSAEAQQDTVVKGEPLTITIENNAGANGFEVEDSGGSTVYLEPEEKAFVQEDPWNMPSTYTFDMPTDSLDKGSNTLYVKDLFCEFNFDTYSYQCDTQTLYDTVEVDVQVDSDGDGFLDSNDECPETGDQGLGLDSNGCPLNDADGDGVLDRNDECSEVAGSKSNGCPTLWESIQNQLTSIFQLFSP